MYRSINPPEYNEETIRLINDDPRCQIISTVAFSNGLNAKSLLDSLSLGFASTFDESWQEKGRVGRNPTQLAEASSLRTFVQRRPLRHTLQVSIIRGWLDDPSITTSKGELKGNRNMIDGGFLKVSWR